MTSVKKAKDVIGVQISGASVTYQIRGKRQVDYFQGKVELTVDTENGNRVITEKDLLDYINAKTV